MAAGDLQVLWALARGNARGPTHQARLENFYGQQAASYDSFRERLLHGRGELIAAIDLPPGAALAEFGGGTGRNLEYFGDRLAGCGRVSLVDLCRPLLTVAEARAERHGWANVTCHHGDITTWRDPAGPLDVILTAYCLTMVPDWFLAIDNALANLKPGGLLAVVDFHVSRRHPDAGLVRHGRLTRHFWPLWFGHDGVRPSADHLPYLRARTEQVHLSEQRGTVPWMPFARAPYYTYIGRKRTTPA